MEENEDQIQENQQNAEENNEAVEIDYSLYDVSL